MRPTLEEYDASNTEPNTLVRARAARHQNDIARAFAGTTMLVTAVSLVGGSFSLFGRMPVAILWTYVGLAGALGIGVYAKMRAPTEPEERT